VLFLYVVIFVMFVNISGNENHRLLSSRMVLIEFHIKSKGYVKLKGSIPFHFQEKVLYRNRVGSGFHMEPFAKSATR